MIKTFEEFIGENTRTTNSFRQSQIAESFFQGKELSDITYQEYIENIMKLWEEIIIDCTPAETRKSPLYLEYTEKAKEERQINRFSRIGNEFVCEYILVCKKKTDIIYYFYPPEARSDEKRRMGVFKRSINDKGYICTLNDLTDESKKRLEDYLKSTYCNYGMFDAEDMFYCGF